MCQSAPLFVLLCLSHQVVDGVLCGLSDNFFKKDSRQNSVNTVF